MTYSTELQNALDAMRKITNTADMHVLAQQYNSHITFLGKVNSRGIVKGDTIVWEYGGLKKTGKVDQEKYKETRKQIRARKFKSKRNLKEALDS